MPNWKKLVVSGSDASLNSLNVTNAVTASNFRSTNGAGTPTLISPNNIILSASNAVVIKDSVLRLDAFTNSETGSLTPQAGDLIYNSDRTDVLIYTASEWKSILVEGDASALPPGLISSSAQTDRSWIVGANGFSDFTFSGSGLTGTENDPTLYLTRGEVYRFDIQSGGSHPFRIQSTPNGSAGTQYNDGLSGNDLTSGTLVWNVQFDSPSKLYYQCVNHGSMGGVIHILEKQPDGLVSSSLQLASDISGSFTLVSESLADRLDLRLTTASVAGNVITFTKGDGTTFPILISQTGSVESSSYAAYADSAKFSNLTGKPTLVSSSIQIASDISGSFTTTSASLAERITAATASISDIIDGTIVVASASYAISASHEITFEVSSSHADVADEVPFTGITGKPTLISSSIQIGSEISGSFTSTSASIASTLDSRITTASATLNTVTFTQGDGSTFDVTIDTGSGGGVSSYLDLTNVPVGIVSSSVQIGSDISGSVNSATASLLYTASAVGSNITFTKGDGSTFVVPVAASASSADALVTASVSDQILTFTKGDASTFDVTLPSGDIAQTATVSDTFTNKTSTAVTHSFDTRNVIISVYDSSYNQIIPQQITLDTVNTATITFASPQSGTVVVAKGGHIVTGSIFIDSVAITSDTYTNTTSKTVTHNFSTKEVIVSVYDSSDNLIIPQTVTTTDINTVDITLAAPGSGRVVVAKAGHIVTASLDFTNLLNTPTLISSSNQLAADISGSFTITSSSIAARIEDIEDGTTVVPSASFALTSSHAVNLSVSQSVTINGYTLPTSDGVDGQTMITDGSGNIVFDDIKVYTQVKNISGGTLFKGTPVHATASAFPPPGNISEIIAASASDASTMPATFILGEDLANEAEGRAISVGYIKNVNTSGFTVGDVVYVGPNGGYTNVKPTGTNLIQNLGVVTKVDALSGAGFIYGSGRSNDVPNIAQGYAWVGNNNLVATATPTSSFYVDNAVTASHAVNALTASYAISASHEITFEVSSSHAEVADQVPFSGITGLPTLLSSSIQIGSDISGSFTSTSSSIATDITKIIDGTTTVTSASNAITASYALNAGAGAGFPFSGSAVITGSLYVSGSTISGSFAGDGSQLTGISVEEVTTVTDTFTSVTSKSVTHNFNSKNILVSVYNNSDQLIIPASLTTTDVNTVDITFDTSTSGRVVVGKAGHVISGSVLGSYRESVSGASSYSVTHNLDVDYPLVQSYLTSTKEQIIPKTIRSVDTNSILVEFDQTFAGTIVVKK